MAAGVRNFELLIEQRVDGRLVTRVWRPVLWERIKVGDVIRVADEDDSYAPFGYEVLTPPEDRDGPELGVMQVKRLEVPRG